MLGKEHSDYADTLADLARLYDATGERDRALPLLRQALRITRHGIDQATAVQSERQQLAMASALRGQLDALLALASRAKLSGEQVYPEVLAWKGAVLARRRVLQAGWEDPKLDRLLADLRAASTDLSRLAFQGPGQEGYEAWKARAAELAERKERRFLRPA